MASDVESISSIYNHYVLNDFSTFEETPVTPGVVRDRIQTSADLGLPWLVAEEAGKVVGYAYASRWKERYAYRFTVEVTVYVSQSCPSRGWGGQLYSALFSELESGPNHIAIAVIALPNPASIALHERFGMEKVAHFKEVGYKFDQWVDVGYWQGSLTT